MFLTIFTNNMDKAVRFYSEVLGMTLTHRFGDHWAQLKDEQDGMVIGLHPASKETPAGGKGSMQLGISVKKPIRDVMADLQAKGAKFTPDVRDDGQMVFADFEDPDGHRLYLAEMKVKAAEGGKKTPAA